MPALDQVSRPVPILSSSRAAAAAATSRGAASTSKTANTNRNAPPNNTGNLPLVSDDRRKTALLHLDKMRAASTVVLAYMCTTDKYDVPRDTLVKAHRTANTGIEFVRETMRLHREQHQKTVKVRLEDAWLKPLVMPSKETTTTTDAAGLETTDGAADLKPPPRSSSSSSRTTATKSSSSPLLAEPRPADGGAQDAFQLGPRLEGQKRQADSPTALRRGLALASRIRTGLHHDNLFGALALRTSSLR